MLDVADTVSSPGDSAGRGGDVVVIAVHDGWFGCGTGAGWSNRRMIELVDELLPPEVTLVVMPVDLAEDSPNRDADAGVVANAYTLLGGGV